MKFIIFLSILVLVNGKPQSNPQEYLTEDDESGRAIPSNAPKAITCSESERKLVPDPILFKIVENCSNPEIYGTKPGKLNPNCAGICQGKALGLLNEKGLPTKELYFNFIEKKMLQKHIKRKWLILNMVALTNMHI